MKISTIYRLIISIFIFAFGNTVFSHENTFVSLSPALTEMMYSIGAEKNLLGVSTICVCPPNTPQKPKIGNSYFINKEVIIKIKPDYILAADGSRTHLQNFDKIGITPLYFEMHTIDAIYKAITTLGIMTGKQENALRLKNKIQKNISLSKTKNPKRILYLIQINPFVTIGNKCFLSDEIKHSGQISVTSDLNSFYPSVSEEYLLKTNPDVIIVSMKSDEKRLKKLFPNKKIIYLSPEMNNIVNRPGPRVDEAVKFFSQI